jgi:hypothetical protein
MRSWRKTAEKFEGGGMRPYKTPLDTKGRDDGAPLLDDITTYQSLIGSLNYLASCTRPDIDHSVISLGQHNSCPNTNDWDRARRVLKYVLCTSEMRFTFEKAEDWMYMYGFLDASYATAERRKSYTGSVIMHCRTAVVWKSKKQKIVTLSAAQAVRG